MALAEITAVQPRDPIHYLGHWLFKFRYNQTMTEINDMELEALTNERDRLAKERWVIYYILYKICYNILKYRKNSWKRKLELPLWI